MKLAVCLFGHVRTFKEIAHQWNQFKDCNFFFHTWNDANFVSQNKVEDSFDPTLLLQFDPEAVIESQKQLNITFIAEANKRGRLSVLRRAVESDCNAVFLSRFDVIVSSLPPIDDCIQISFIQGTVQHFLNAYNDLAAYFLMQKTSLLIEEFEKYEPNLFTRVEDQFESVLKAFNIRKSLLMGREIDVSRFGGKKESVLAYSWSRNVINTRLRILAVLVLIIVVIVLKPFSKLRSI